MISNLPRVGEAESLGERVGVGNFSTSVREGEALRRGFMIGDPTRVGEAGSF